MITIENNMYTLNISYGAIRLAGRFDDIRTTAQVIYCHLEWPRGKQHLAYKFEHPVALPTRYRSQMIQFNPRSEEWAQSGSAARGCNAMKLQAAFTERSGKAASCKLVWK